MRRHIEFAFAAFCAAAFALSCAKEQGGLSGVSGSDEVSGDFTIVASVDNPDAAAASAAGTRTTIDGRKTSWTAGDELGVFHGEANDGKFSVADVAAGAFSGSLKAELAETNDWLAVYPYADNASLAAYPLTIPVEQKQDADNPTGHLCGAGVPLWGKTAAVAKDDVPTFAMHHVAAFVKLHVTNARGTDVPINKIELWASDASCKLSGNWHADFTGDSPALTAQDGAEQYVRVVSDNVVVKDGEAVDIYAAIAPCTIKKGTILTVWINGTYDTDVTLPDDIIFKPGMMNTINLTYDNNSRVYVMGDALKSDANGDGMQFSESQRFVETGAGTNVYEWTGHLNWARSKDGTACDNQFRFVRGVGWDGKPITFYPAIDAAIKEDETQVKMAREINRPLMTKDLSMISADRETLEAIDYWFAITAAGTYHIVLNKADMSVTVEALEFDEKYSNVTDVKLVYLEPNKWTEGPSMMRSSEDSDVWTWTGELVGEDNSQSKGLNFFLYADGTENDRWTCLAGTDAYLKREWKLEERIFDCSGYTGQIYIQETATYTITLNTAKRTVSIAAVE